MSSVSFFIELILWIPLLTKLTFVLFDDLTSSSKLYIFLIIFVIASLDVLERSASSRTDSATTLKPLPCSPARAASIEAFRARRLVWLVISDISLAKVAISLIPSARFNIEFSVVLVAFLYFPYHQL